MTGGRLLVSTNVSSAEDLTVSGTVFTLEVRAGAEHSGDVNFNTTSQFVLRFAAGGPVGTGTISGPGAVTALSASALSPSSSYDIDTVSGVLNVQASQTIGSLSGEGNVQIIAGTLTVGGDDSSTTFNGTISGSGNLTKAGDGTLTLNGTNTFTGTTPVSDGRLSGSGSLSGSLVVATGATAAPGNSPGILNTGNFDLHAGSTLEMEFGGTSPGNTATDHDLISGHNSWASIYLNGSGVDGTVIAGNLIGLNAAGNSGIYSTGHPTSVSYGPHDTRIGTDGDGFADDLERNVISGNQYELVAQGSTTLRTVIAGNYFGTAVTGQFAVPNGTALDIPHGTSDTRIGTDGSNDAFNANERNVFAGNTGGGIAVRTRNWNGDLPPRGETTDNTVIAGGYIGAAADGLINGTYPATSSSTTIDRADIRDVLGPAGRRQSGSGWRWRPLCKSSDRQFLRARRRRILLCDRR